MMKHTPGPWVYNSHKAFGEKKRSYMIHNNKFRQAINIARVIDDVDLTDEEVQANAKIMTASPEMLNVLIETKEVLLQLDTRLNGTCYNPGSVGDCECTLCKINKVIKEATE